MTCMITVCEMEPWQKTPLCLVPKETENEPTGPYPELAAKVRELLAGMSTRVAQRKTGVSHSTIAAMANGDKVGEGTINRFARGFGVDPKPLLKAAGLPITEYRMVTGSDVHEELPNDTRDSLNAHKVEFDGGVIYWSEALSPDQEDIVVATIEVLLQRLRGQKTLQR